MDLYYKKIGKKGPVILILHGLFGNGKNWYSIAKYLSKSYQVYSLDLRNHGLSAHSDKMNYSDMVNDLVEFMDKHKLEQVNILGHSMGGKLAMLFALEYPTRIHQLVVVDIAPVVYKHRFKEIFSALLDIPLKQINSRVEAEKSLFERIKDKGICQFLLQNLCLKNSNCHLPNHKQKIDANYWRFNVLALKKNIGNIATFPIINKERQFLGETLFIAGQNSDYINKNNRIEIKHYFPSSKIVKVKGAGHWLHAEKPDVVKNILSIFFK